MINFLVLYSQDTRIGRGPVTRRSLLKPKQLGDISANKLQSRDPSKSRPKALPQSQSRSLSRMAVPTRGGVPAAATSYLNTSQQSTSQLNTSQQNTSRLAIKKPSEAGDVAKSLNDSVASQPSQLRRPASKLQMISKLKRPLVGSANVAPKPTAAECMRIYFMLQRCMFVIALFGF